MNKRLVLGSGSPRRKELIESLGYVEGDSYRVLKSDCEENTTKSLPAEVVMELSEQKAKDVWGKLSEEEKTQAVVLGADTIVAYGNQILGKPKNEEDAVSMLTMLSNQSHSVYTGVTLLWMEDGKQKQNTFFEETAVSVYALSKQEIEDYVATKEPMDKAGAYAIQGYFGKYIKEIRGEYNTVVGLPVARLYQELKQLKLC